MNKRSAGRTQAGFTLIELMIVIAIIAIIAAIAVPNLLAARMSANETATVSTLRTITTAQAQFQRAGYADENNDGVGEYGTMGELGASVLVRGTTRYAVADLSASLAVVGTSGEVSRNGYLFRMYLPLAGGVGFQEIPGGGMTPGVLDPTTASVNWCVYAYPEHYAGSGNRTYFANERCELTTTTDPRYQLTGCPAIEAGAALRVGDITHITGAIAVGTRGADGNLWKAVQ
jgi:prepilin-type N-terminal cleavage/methylation domain-containing protein